MRKKFLTALLFLSLLVPSAFASENYNGVERFPLDLSYLADNPPNENIQSKKLLKTLGDTLPSTYDLRNVDGNSYVTPVKDQGSYNQCWSFAAMGAMESNYLKQTGTTLDLSEQHLSWFRFKNSDKTKTFNNTKYSDYSGKNFSVVMDQGGNSFYPAGLYSRLDGPTLDSNAVYGTQPSEATPQAYPRALRLRDVYYLSFTNVNVNENSTARDIVKRRIMSSGAVVANYHNVNSDYQKTASGGTAFYNTGTSISHAVLIVGWDDNYSRDNFKTKPNMDGAWLIKNSWGSQWGNGTSNVGDDGYFWMSYAQYLDEGSAYIVEAANDDMNVYYYDALGWTATSGYQSNGVYTANIFECNRDGESLIEVGFYTPDNNINYEINIYKGMSGVSASSPINDSSLSTTTGTIPFAGYHTVTLDTPVELSEGEFFSVVVNFKNTKSIPVENKNANMSANATFETGSLTSGNGTSWRKLTDSNTCVKAFTVTADNIAPEITTDYPSDPVLNVAYSYQLEAKGTRPLTWSVSSGSLPAGLTLDVSTGIISGTATVENENCTFAITVTNESGTNSKTFTMNVQTMPTIMTEELTGYVGYEFDETLELSNSEISATWSAGSALPKGLTLNSSTGKITGKPKTARTSTIKFTASTLVGDVTSDVKIIIEGKPVKPKISTSKLPDGMIGTAYSQKITFSGTTPVTLSIEDGIPDGLTFNTDTGLLSGTPAAAGDFELVVKAENIFTELNDIEVTKKIKLKIKAIAPKIDTPSEMPVAVAGEEYEGYGFSLSAGTEPVTWKASGLPKGMSLSTDGELTGTPAKAGKFNITLKADNNGGKASLKVPFVVYATPEITTTKLSDATTGKKYTAKLKATGTGPISWDISGLPGTLNYSLSKADGTQLTITGTPTAAGTLTLNMKVSNDVGTFEKSLELKIKGVAPKLKTVFKKGQANANYNGATITATGTLPITITHSINETDLAKFNISGLSDLGLTFTADEATGTATVTGTPTKSIKNLPIYFTATNSTGTATKKANLTIAGTKPKFTDASAQTITQEAGSGVEISLTVTGTQDITFTMNKIDGLTLTPNDDGLSAVISGTAPSKPGKTSIKVTATNADGKAVKKITLVTTAATPDEESSPENLDSTATDIKEDVKSDNAGENSLNETQDASPVVTLGSERTISSIRKIDADKLQGCIIAAVLPEMSVNVSGLYDFEVDLDENTGPNKKLYWFAFAQNRDKSEDDDIAEFYTIDGQEITSTPENLAENENKILISVWLNSGDIYAPVIAVNN